MNVASLLEELKAECENATADFIMPTRKTKDMPDMQPRVPRYFKMKLSKSSSYDKLAPYGIIQFITSQIVQRQGTDAYRLATVRIILCTYDEIEEEGALALVEFMERLVIRFCKKAVIGGRFTLDLDPNREGGLETFVYPEETTPYFGGEIITHWRMPVVQKEVTHWQ